MKMEEMYGKMQMQNAIISGISDLFEGCKELFWDSIENQPVECFFGDVTNMFADDSMKYISCGVWCFDLLSIQAMTAIYDGCVERDLPILFVPEMMVFLICKDKSLFDEALSKFSKAFLEKTSINIKSIEMSDNGVVFNYNTKSSFKAFEERPAYVYDLIEAERNKAR